MKNEVEIKNQIRDNGFPDELTNGVSDLHELEGTLWMRDNDIAMFCQVAPHAFAMIVLSEGNRNIDSFTLPDYHNVLEDLKSYKRFKGTIFITTR